MRRIGIILVFCTLWATNGFAVSRTSGTSAASTRAGTPTQHVRTQTTTSRKAVHISAPQTKTVSRSTVKTTNSPRSVTTRNTTTPTRTGVVSRAATITTSETRTGAEYELCKNAYFACMDQFCQLKNDEYRRCSCSDRISSLQSERDNLQQAAEQLTAFNENLDIVGKTAAQAAAMNTASDGELALSKDNSASKALLTAIMNSIRGTDSRVENSKLSDLNSVDLSFDTANSFGTSDVGQTIAAYNGQALYSAVYPQCRTAVRPSCNDASLQRAVNAYLMAIEQDCNTVQTAIANKKKETHAAIRESGSMLDMARAENHKAHNSDDAATCLANVEAAILSEEVCGFNYHKCLDNGEYIDVTTGAPIAGVVDFYKLGTLLTFNSERTNPDQKLAQNSKNRTFVNNFEKRVKQFAEPALDKCVDDADTVWADYLNKAMLDIYYAQQSKVREIKQGCFDFVSACYMNSDTAMTNAMRELVAAQTTVLNPNVITLNQSLCSDYIASCNNMFDGQIVAEYIDNRQDTDVLTACRAVAKQCFDNYGGVNYENFYYPSSGLFSTGSAPDWFALYEFECDDIDRTNCVQKDGYKSECAQQLAAIDSCSNLVEEAFGGFNLYTYTGSTQVEDNNIYGKYAYNNQIRLLRPSGIATEVYNQIIDILQTQCSNLDGKFMNVQNLALYADNYAWNSFCSATFNNSNSRYHDIYQSYSIGKTVHECINSLLDYGIFLSNLDNSNNSDVLRPRTREAQIQVQCTDTYYPENMCPNNYDKNVDIQSWGACLCWENGGRRSNNGTSTRCTYSFPVQSLVTYDIKFTEDGSNQTYSSQQNTTHGLNNSCDATFYTDSNRMEFNNVATLINASDNTSRRTYYWSTGNFTLWPNTVTDPSDTPTEQDWCTANINSSNQVCPFGVKINANTNECNNCPFDWVTTIYCPVGYEKLAEAETQSIQPNNGLPSVQLRDSLLCTTTNSTIPQGSPNYQKHGPTTCPEGYTSTATKCVKNSTNLDPNAADEINIMCCPKNYLIVSTDSSHLCKPLGSLTSVTQSTPEPMPISKIIMGEEFPE